MTLFSGSGPRDWRPAEVSRRDATAARRGTAWPWVFSIVLGVAALIAVGGWALSGSGQGPMPGAAPGGQAAPFVDLPELRVGDCIADTEGQEVLVACDQPHLWEVIHAGVAPEELAPDGTSTGLEPLYDEARRQCAPVFEAYTGQPIDATVELSVHMSAPTLFEWAQGDRALVCGVGRAGGPYAGLIGPPPA